MNIEQLMINHNKHNNEDGDGYLKRNKRNNRVNILHSDFLLFCLETCFASWNVNIEKELTNSLNYNSISAKVLCSCNLDVKKIQITS